MNLCRKGISIREYIPLSLSPIGAPEMIEHYPPAQLGVERGKIMEPRMEEF